jgi:hypothetical protein
VEQKAAMSQPQKTHQMNISITLSQTFNLIWPEITPVPAGKELHLHVIPNNDNQVDIFVVADDMGNKYPGWGQRLKFWEVMTYADEKSAGKLVKALMAAKLHPKEGEWY